MTELPRDLADLHLAPVALAVERRIAALGALSDEKLALEVAISSNEADWSLEMRQDAMLRTVGQFIDLHGWLLSWDARGLRLAHGKHSLVLGLPANFTRYLAGTARTGTMHAGTTRVGTRRI